MATDSIAGLRSQIEDALTVLDPVIRGVEDIVRTSVSPDLISALNNPPLASMHDRRRKSQTILDDIDKLLADVQALENTGWPGPLTFVLPDRLLNELKTEETALAAGASVFSSSDHPPAAANLEVTFGRPVPKPKTTT